MDVLNTLKNKRNSAVPRIKEIVKAFGKFTIELNSQLKEKKNQKTEKEHSEFLKTRIVEFIKTHFKEKGFKNDLKTFYLVLLYELYRILNQLIDEFDLSKNQLNEEKIVSIIKLNYDFNEQIFVSSDEVYNKITNNKIDYSNVIYLLISLSYIKICDVTDLIYDKDHEISDISLLIIKVLIIYQKIYNYSQNISEKNAIFFNFVQKSFNEILPYYAKLLLEILDDPELKSVLGLIEYDFFAILYNELSEIKLIRKFLIEIYVKLNLSVKDGIKIRKIRRNFLENKCLEGILSNIKKNYSHNNFDNIQDIFKELIYLLLISTVFYENIKEIKLEVNINLYLDF